MHALFKRRIDEVDAALCRFDRLETIQVNLGDLCNLSCAHCLHHASPRGTRVMRRAVMEKVAAFLSRRSGLTLDITGGAPEMNPDFPFLVEATDGLAARRIVRCNLAVVTEPGMEWLPEFYRVHSLVVMASLPCYLPENVERQRGNGTFEASIEALRRLNAEGYGDTRELHLVHNPGADSVFGSRETLERDYRAELKERFGVVFNRLHCINNAPVGRFRKELERQGGYRRYLEHLADRFNPDAADRIMCRTLLSVGWDGTLHNCDFNLAAGLPIQRADGSSLTIDRIDEAVAPGGPIRVAEHCFGCTAGEGSGCGGTFVVGESSSVSTEGAAARGL